MAKRTKPIDFSISNPPRAVTDPDRSEREEQGIPTDTEYPKHLVKPDLEGPGGVEYREVVTVTDAAGERSKRAQGYGTHQEADAAERKAKDAPAPKAAKLKPAKAPRNPKPKAPKGEK